MTRAREHGFTLVEMLVALAIFALVSAAGVMLLRSSVDTQIAVSERLGEGSAILRTRALLSADLASAQPRPVRDASGTPQSAFATEAGGIAFTHAAIDEAGIERLERTRFALENGNLVRRSTPAVDGGAEAVPAVLVREVTGVRWRVRNADGGWSEGWSAENPARLPRAVELTLDRSGAPTLTMMFLVGPDGLPAPEAAQ
jgi:general secretion pathway protein J